MPGKTCGKCGRSMDEHWREEHGPYECPTSQVNEREMRLSMEFIPRFAYDPAKTRQAIEAVRAAEAEANDERELAIRKIAQAEMEMGKLDNPEPRTWKVTPFWDEGENYEDAEGKTVEVVAATPGEAKAKYREQDSARVDFLHVEPA